MNAQARNVILVRFLIQKHISKPHSSTHLEELYPALGRATVQCTSKWWEFHSGNTELSSILSRTNLGKSFRMYQWKQFYNILAKIGN